MKQCFVHTAPVSLRCLMHVCVLWFSQKDGKTGVRAVIWLSSNPNHISKATEQGGEREKKKKDVLPFSSISAFSSINIVFSPNQRSSLLSPVEKGFSTTSSHSSGPMEKIFFGMARKYHWGVRRNGMDGWREREREREVVSKWSAWHTKANWAETRALKSVFKGLRIAWKRDLRCIAKTRWNIHNQRCGIIP